MESPKAIATVMNVRKLVTILFYIHVIIPWALLGTLCSFLF